MQESAASSLGSWDTFAAAPVAVAGCSGGDLSAVRCWRDSREQTDWHSYSAPFPGYWTEGPPVEVLPDVVNQAELLLPTVLAEVAAVAEHVALVGVAQALVLEIVGVAQAVVLGIVGVAQAVVLGIVAVAQAAVLWVADVALLTAVQPGPAVDAAVAQQAVGVAVLRVVAESAAVAQTVAVTVLLVWSDLSD